MPSPSTIVRLPRRPRSQPDPETMRAAAIAVVQEAIQTDGRTRHQIAAAACISVGTVHRIATGDTRWPRHTTLFPLIVVLGLRLTIGKDR